MVSVLGKKNSNIEKEKQFSTFRLKVEENKV